MLDRTKEQWPPPYNEVFDARFERLCRLRAMEIEDLDEREEEASKRWAAAIAHYKDNPKDFIRHWGVVLEPRAAGAAADAITLLPFVTFQKQEDYIDFLYSLLNDVEDGLIEKSRDMGATWGAVWVSIHIWRFYPGAVVGWGSKGQDEVDQINNPNSIFQKIRIGIRNLPYELWPEGFDPDAHMPFMRITNPETDAAIIGDVGDNIGRGGRSLIYFKDESAHYVHPELVEAALSENTRIQVDLSSVRGLGTVFHRKREAGVEWYPGVKDLPKGRTRVLVMDWRDHPGKTQEWYNNRRAQYEAQGLLHILAQEIDRDYSASVEGVIIPSLWIKAAIDAHIKLQLHEYEGFSENGRSRGGMWGAGLDVADEGGDTNAIAIRQGILLREVGEWGARDPGVTTRNVIAAVHDILPLELQYDCVGIGAAVKAEANRLFDEKKIPKGLRLVPWNAGSEPQDKEGHVIPNDRSSPVVEDFFENLKAQAWWMVARRFEITYRAVNEADFTYDPADIISISSKIPLLRKLEKELAQPTFKQSGRLKLMVDKKPKGAKSPNMADAVIMAYWPIKKGKPLVISADVLAKARLPGMIHAAMNRTR